MLRHLVFASLLAMVFCTGCQNSRFAPRNPFASFSNPFSRVDDQYEPVVSAEETTSGSEEVEPEESGNRYEAYAEEPETDTFRMASNEQLIEDKMRISPEPIPDPLGVSDRESRQPRSEKDDLASKGDAAMRSGNYAKATAFYREVVRLDPKNVDAHHRLAFIADEQKNYTLSEKHYLEALAIDPENVNVMNDLGYSYLQQRRFEDSARYLNGSLEIDPENRTALGNLGLLAATYGDLGPAAEFLQQAGMSPAEAQQKIQEVQQQIQSTPKKVAGAWVNKSPSSASTAFQNTEERNNGSTYQSPSPDWASTYGLNQSDARSPANRDSQVIKIEPAVQHNSTEPMIRQASNQQPAATPFAQQAGQFQRSSQFETPSDYALERAALNAGPGSLFPMTSASDYSRAVESRPVNLNISPNDNPHPIEYPHSQPTSPAQPGVNQWGGSAPLIQTPVNYEAGDATQGRSSAAVTQQQIPLTSAGTQSLSRAGYDQFPGRPAGNTTGGTQPSAADSMRAYESQLNESNNQNRYYR